MSEVLPPLTMGEDFMLSRCPEWVLYQTRDAAVSVEALGKTERYPEELRVTASLYTLGYLHSGTQESYQKLVGESSTTGPGQDPTKRLQPEQFAQLHEVMREVAADQASFDAFSYISNF